MDVVRISPSLLSPLARLGAPAPPARTAVAPTEATIDLTVGRGRDWLPDRTDPGVLAWERSLIDVRRQGSGRRGDTAATFAEPALQRAVETLGVHGRLSQQEVDRRFRQIVKAERPDLGAMSGERLDALRAARSTLTAHLQRRRWVALDPAPPLGTLADVAA